MGEVMYRKVLRRIMCRYITFEVGLVVLMPWKVDGEWMGEGGLRW